MHSALKFLVPALAASLTLAACGSSSSKSSSSSQAPAATTSSSSAGEATAAVVKTASNATLGGTVLVDAQGMTLYSLSAEQKGKFICTNSACLGVWHPLSASSAATPSGSVGSLGTVKRPDGTEQVTYKGMPLYTFAQDQAPGDVKGQGFKDVGTWKAVTTSAKSSSAPAAAAPATTPAKSAPAPAEPAPEKAAPPASSGGGSGGYGY
jgi:predicted lipoprotein with Yx(FWY)xxD motif